VPKIRKRGSVRVHGVVFSQINTGTTLPFINTKTLTAVANFNALDDGRLSRNMQCRETNFKKDIISNLDIVAWYTVNPQHPPKKIYYQLQRDSEILHYELLG
jgi:hypothetical protein